MPCAPHRQSRTCLSTEESPGHPEHPHELGSGAGQGTQVLRLLRPVSVWHTAPRANPARFRLATGARLRLAVTHQGPAQRPQQSANRTEPPVSGAGAETAPSLPGGMQKAFATSGGWGDTRVRKAVTQSCPGIEPVAPGPECRWTSTTRLREAPGDTHRRRSQRLDVRGQSGAERGFPSRTHTGATPRLRGGARPPDTAREREPHCWPCAAGTAAHGPLLHTKPPPKPPPEQPRQSSQDPHPSLLGHPPPR